MDLLKLFRRKAFLGGKDANGIYVDMPALFNEADQKIAISNLTAFYNEAPYRNGKPFYLRWGALPSTDRRDLRQPEQATIETSHEQVSPEQIYGLTGSVKHKPSEYANRIRTWGVNLQKYQALCEKIKNGDLQAQSTFKYEYIDDVIEQIHEYMMLSPKWS